MPYEYKYIPKFTNRKDYIPKEIYTLIPRVTEVCNTLTCMFPAWQNDVNRVERGEEPLNIRGANYPALRGTLTHYDIESFIDNQLGVETDPLELSAVENQLLIRLKEMGTLEELYDEVASGFETFIKWWEMYDPTPLVSEQEVVHVKYHKNGLVNPKKSLKGTVDFIAEIDMDKLNRVAKKEVTNGGKWEIVNDKFTCAIDWKTGKDAWKVHQLQLTGYDYLLNDSGWWEEAVRTGQITTPPFLIDQFGFESKMSMCVKTGAKKPITTIYDVGEHKQFFRAWDSFNNPKNSTFSDTQGKSNGLKRMCQFCEFRNFGCPLFSFEVKGEIQLV